MHGKIWSSGEPATFEISSSKTSEFKKALQYFNDRGNEGKEKEMIKKERQGNVDVRRPFDFRCKSIKNDLTERILVNIRINGLKIELLERA